MLKFFRHVRQQLIQENKMSKYFKYAIGEIVLVVIGILIALQINNWNENRKQRNQEQLILNKLAVDLQNDIKLVNDQITNTEFFKEEFKSCLDILSSQKQTTLEQFNEHFSGILFMASFDINETTFNSITESRTIDYIKNKQLVDSLNTFYNSNYKSWDNAQKEYTRNVIGPYLMEFDYNRYPNYDRLKTNSSRFTNNDFSDTDISKFEVKPKTLSDFKSDIFIINALRQRLFLTEGQTSHYQKLKNKMERLLKQVQSEIE
jgi:hypothetical protein